MLLRDARKERCLWQGQKAAVQSQLEVDVLARYWLVACP